MPTVSIVMPAYNEEKYIVRAVDSILKQTYKDFEFIIVNDCSTDATEAMVRSINDDRIILVSNDINLGVAGSLNKGIAMSRGKYIARMDADDYASCDRLMRQYEFMESNPSVGLAGSWCYLVRGGDEATAEEIRMPVGHNEIVEYLKKDNPFIHSSILMRRHVFDECGPYKLEKGMEDYDLFIKIAEKYKTHILPHFLVTRNEDNNIETKKTYDGLNLYKMYKMRLKYQLIAIKKFGFTCMCPWYLTRTMLRIVQHRIFLK